ncbi:arsenate reductase [Ophiocordyceps camponoti-floridani]|uniref:Arsenate reductase n=1 Tax=Ophiocordyceps camponoti-floridani TaxID=2030778 RepID=A0A8H4QAY5_9HYPO|nr:arsenate reductase [Ophiocordyceps camponoti-floridani]
MKLTAGLLAASCGFFATAQSVAKVYILSARETSPTSPSLSPALARLVLLQRLGAINHEPALRDYTESAAIQDAVSALNSFGKETSPLVRGEDGGKPSQLVVMLEGVTADQMDVLGRALGSRPAFEISATSSSKARDEMVRVDFQATGANDVGHCNLRQITNPLEDCWNGQQSAFAKFNAREVSVKIDDLAHRLTQLSQLAKIGELETALVLLPWTASTKAQPVKPQELRKRHAEQVSLDRTPPAPTPENAALYATTGRIPSCFNSEESCVTATKNCSGHGGCIDKYSNGDGSSGGEACFACHCLSTRSDSGSLTHWAGPSCAKKDISVAFWLFAGVTLALVFILWLAVSMLFNVGQEKLPGVIGAGVSRAR